MENASQPAPRLGAPVPWSESPALAMGLVNEPLALLPAFAAAPQRLPSDLAAGIAGSVAVVPVTGVLVHGPGDEWWGTRSYGGIRGAIAEALEESSVRAIVLLVNSPGGHCSGCFELADFIFEARGRKPIIAVLDDAAYSAAYCLAAAADMVTIPEGGGAGSIGTVMVHMDLSGLYAQLGIGTTVIRSAARKFEGNSVEPLTDGARARLQSDIDMLADMFIDRIARFREGKITAEQIRDTEGGTFLGARAVESGLADEVMRPDRALQEILETFAQAAA